MKRPPYIVATTLFVLWLLLNISLSPAQALLGAMVTIGLVLGLDRLRPVPPRVRAPAAIARLVGRAMVDIVRSNFAVARIVLDKDRRRRIRSGFVDVPLDVRDPHALAVLAMIVTSTPGTVWAGLAPDGASLTLHVLDLRDEAQVIRIIKQRYEQLLLEIFK